MGRTAGKKLSGSKHKGARKLGGHIERVTNALDNPGTNKLARRGAIAAGAGLVGLQTVNWLGDTIPVTPGFRTPVKSQGAVKAEKKKVSRPDLIRLTSTLLEPAPSRLRSTWRRSPPRVPRGSSSS